MCIALSGEAQGSARPLVALRNHGMLTRGGACPALQVDLGRPAPVQALIDAHFWGEADAVEVRADLADTGIYLCAPEVLLLFSDNFDYQVGLSPWRSSPIVGRCSLRCQCSHAPHHPTFVSEAWSCCHHEL